MPKPLSRPSSPEPIPRTKKHLGQNFLTDENILRKIVAACGFKEDQHVLEIGPGRGALTRHIAPHVKSLYAVEMDPQLHDLLEREFPEEHIHLIRSDFLKFAVPALPVPVTIIGNLPYNISTPIIEKLISERRVLTDAFLTVQHEFGKRLTAQPRSKDYGSLSCYIQYYADVRILFLIKPSCFRPVPKVTSCFLKLSFRNQGFSVTDEEFLFKFIRSAFQHRRKTLANALSGLYDKTELLRVLEQLNINPSARPDALSLTDYCDIINRIQRAER